MTSGETWLPVREFEGVYEVSDHGRVRSVDRKDNHGRSLKGRILKERRARDGRPHLTLSSQGRVRDLYLYTLVLEAFVCPRPPGMLGLHWDDNPQNNHLSNLRWGTHAENMRDMSRNGGGSAGITHCPSGHEYTPENTYVYPGERKHRLCRACRKRHGENQRRKAREKKRTS